MSQHCFRQKYKAIGANKGARRAYKSARWASFSLNARWAEFKCHMDREVESQMGSDESQTGYAKWVHDKFKIKGEIVGI